MSEGIVLFIIDLIYNLSVLTALSVLSGFLRNRFRQGWQEHVLQGALFGCVAVVGMLRPLDMGGGVIFDGRSVIISLCGLFFGPLAAGLAAVMAAGFRAALGGDGQVVGIMVILASTAIGLLFHYGCACRGERVSLRMLLGLGLLVHAVMLLLMGALPHAIVAPVLKRITPTVLLIYPFATVLIGKILSDQNERKRFMAELQRSREQLRTTLYSIGDGIITTDDKGLVRQINPVAERLLGWTESEACGKPYGEVFRIVNEATREVIDNPVERVLRDGRVVELARYTLLLARDGKEYPIADSGAPIRNKDGVVTGVVLVFRDQSSERAAQRSVQAERDNLRAIMTASPVAILVVDDAVCVTDANPAAERLFGRKLAELPERRCGDLIGCVNCLSDKACGQADQCPACVLFKALRDVLATGRPVYDREMQATLGRPGAARTCWIRFSVEAVKLDGRRHALVAMSDFTQHRQTEEAHSKLEAQFRHSQKMEAIGRLAGGVAHDFNNILQSILGYGELLLERLPESSESREFAREIMVEGQRAAGLTRQLLAFARKQEIDPKVINLNEQVAGTLKMLRRLLTEEIELEWRPAANEPCFVKMDVSQLDQVLANLVLNARDAITGAGKVAIVTQKVMVDASFSPLSPDCKPGPYVMLAVSDNGCGMERSTLERLFEPFFTTKELGQGTGLGLATVYGIVRQNHGFIQVASEVRKGSAFKIYLPAEVVPAPSPEAEAPKSADAAPASETVLIVDDEEALLRSARRTLEGLGYKVLAAGSPGEALRLAEEYPEEIHLLLTDMVMPGMSGRDLWLKLQPLRPGMKCVFMSGYTANIIAQRSILDNGVHFLQKPFSKADLAGKLRDVLVRGVS